jgi:isopenicillin N synthase-like dioxygenase
VVGREKVSQMLFDRDALVERRKVPDVKESFEMGREDNAAMPNIWLPEPDLPGFRSFFNAFYARCHALELDLLRALALGLGLGPADEDYFVRFHQRADNQTRILHYPPVPVACLRSAAAERCGAHSDFGTLTLLFQDRVGGLEVEHPRREGLFRPAPYIHGTAVVNAGDFLKMWTNDLLKSTLHRVRAPSVADDVMAPARYSIPYFCGPDTEKVVECAPGCYGPDRPKRYGPTTVGEYINKRMNAIYQT